MGGSHGVRVDELVSVEFVIVRLSGSQGSSQKAWRITRLQRRMLISLDLRRRSSWR